MPHDAELHECGDDSAAYRMISVIVRKQGGINSGCRGAVEITDETTLLDHRKLTWTGSLLG
jgi:hypothetical protein